MWKNNARKTSCGRRNRQYTRYEVGIFVVTEPRLTDLLGALRLRGIQPLRADGNGRRAVWVFNENPGLRSVVEDFYGRRLALDALTYAEAIRSAKGEAMQLRGGT